ncbi:MAG: LysM peptidoglycan-binding domain-containing protein [Anaerovoracaceae bacterium]
MLNKKRFKIKSKLKFTMFIAMMIICTVMATNTVLGFNDAKANAVNEQSYEIEISNGDTLWNIATSHKSENTDLREAIYKICKVNNIKAHDLDVGMKIIIPTDI